MWDNLTLKSRSQTGSKPQSGGKGPVYDSGFTRSLYCYTRGAPQEVKHRQTDQDAAFDTLVKK